MKFREYYFNKYPYLDNWGNGGEEMTDVINRVVDTMGEYIEDVLNEQINKSNI